MQSRGWRAERPHCKRTATMGKRTATMACSTSAAHGLAAGPHVSTGVQHGGMVDGFGLLALPLGEIEGRDLEGAEQDLEDAIALGRPEANRLAGGRRTSPPPCRLQSVTPSCAASPSCSPSATSAEARPACGSSRCGRQFHSRSLIVSVTSSAPTVKAARSKAGMEKMGRTLLEKPNRSSGRPREVKSISSLSFSSSSTWMA